MTRLVWVLVNCWWEARRFSISLSGKKLWGSFYTGIIQDSQSHRWLPLLPWGLGATEFLFTKLTGIPSVLNMWNLPKMMVLPRFNQILSQIISILAIFSWFLGSKGDFFSTKPWYFLHDSNFFFHSVCLVYFQEYWGMVIFFQEKFADLNFFCKILFTSFLPRVPFPHTKKSGVETHICNFRDDFCWTFCKHLGFFIIL